MNQQNAIEEVLKILSSHHLHQTADDFITYKSPSELASILCLDRDDCQGDFSKTVEWITKYLEFGIKSSHPSFVNRMWAGANLPSILGELAVAFSNTSACTYESAPVSTLMENFMIREMLDLVGFKNGEGQMTTGSSNANMIAMMCARNLPGRQIKQKGLCETSPLVAFVNSDAHYSMDKAANILGIGIDNLTRIPVNENGEMLVSALEEALEQTIQNNQTPFFVAATAGTTVRGAYDPIEPLLELRKKYNFWLHVDGAWGGSVIMSDKLRSKYLPSLKFADSFTCDFHKMLGSALMCNFLLINNQKSFNSVLTGGDGSYLFRDTDEEGVNDLGSISLQCGRRVDSLKWFLDWKYYGKDGFGQRIEKYLSLCEYAEEIINTSSELELVAPRTSFNICFRYKHKHEDVNEFNQELRTRLYKSGKCLVGIAYINNMLTLRLLITNLSIEQQHVDRFFEQVITTGRMLAHEMEG